MTLSKVMYAQNAVDPYQMLAEAIVIRAITDFRSAARIIRRSQRMLKRKSLTSQEKACLEYKISQCERVRKSVVVFLHSQFFATISHLDGSELLARLEREVS